MRLTAEDIRFNAIAKKYTDFFGKKAWPAFGGFPQFSSLDEFDAAVSKAIKDKKQIEQVCEPEMIY